MPQVQVIQPIQQQPKRLRVAAYARVSSDSTDQLNSLSVQVDYYTHLIQENPNWDFAGIYADEGITGTSTKHREQFNRLLDDCRAGLIDRVLVKSASRFARNTADALASVREMKSLGVTVVFEKEGFDTETANGEMILSMICATAQEESLSISQNTKWGIRKKMHDGTYITSLTPFGYKKINRQLFPDEKEAATVKEIFNLFLNGFSTAEIANHLNTNHPKPDVIWRSASVRFILRNEKYIGDSLFQKNYTPDTLPLKSCCNTGQLPKYYVEGTHPGIISKDEFERVQSLLTQKNINSTNSRACITTRESSRSRHSERHKLKLPAATASRPPTIASDIEVATTANMPYPNDWSVVTAAAPTSESLGASTAESKSSGDASTDLNTERSFAATHPLSPKQSCIKQF